MHLGGLSKPLYTWDYLRSGSSEALQRLNRVNTWHALVESLPQFVLQTYIAALSSLGHATASLSLTTNRLRLYISIALSLRSLVSAMWKLRTGPPPYEFGRGSFVAWGADAWWVWPLMAAATLLETLHRVTLVVLFALVHRGWAVVAVAADLLVKLLWFMDVRVAAQDVASIVKSPDDSRCLWCSFVCLALCLYPAAAAPAAATSLMICVTPTRLEWEDRPRASLLRSDVLVWLLNACGGAALLVTLACVRPDHTAYAKFCVASGSDSWGGGVDAEGPVCLPSWVYVAACTLWGATYVVVLPLLMAGGVLATRQRGSHGGAAPAEPGFKSTAHEIVPVSRGSPVTHRASTMAAAIVTRPCTL